LCGLQSTNTERGRMKSTPIQKVLKKLDISALALSKKLGISHVAVYKWGYSKADKGTGGIIPAKYHKAIMRLAKKMKVDLDPADFVAL